MMMLVIFLQSSFLFSQSFGQKSSTEQMRDSSSRLRRSLQNNSTSTDDCSLPKKVGPCKAAIPRFYFNKSNGACEKFTYGGCQANGNNFLTLDECNRACDVCSLPKKVGPCKAAIPKFYFNKSTGACEKFSFGGCQANGNNFPTIDECNQTCDADVGCGGHRAPNCSECPRGNGEDWCNDDCTWDNGQCVARPPVTRPPVTRCGIWHEGKKCSAGFYCYNELLPVVGSTCKKQLKYGSNCNLLQSNEQCASGNCMVLTSKCE